MGTAFSLPATFSLPCCGPRNTTWPDAEGDAVSTPPAPLKVPARAAGDSLLDLASPTRRTAQPPAPRKADSFEDRYRVLTKLGQLGGGAFSTVHFCEQRRTPDGTRVEKRMRIRLVAKVNDKRRLPPQLVEYREIELHRAARHDNIVTLHDAFEDLKTATLVLEFCPGGELFDTILVEKRRWADGMAFRDTDAAVACRHILRALEFLHASDVAHRDVKAENVLLSRTGVPLADNIFKLCDLGFAATCPAGGLFGPWGSEDTIAPEALRPPHRHGLAGDLWSLGVVAYMTLAGKIPFTSKEMIMGGHYNTLVGATAQARDFFEALLVQEEERPTAAEALRAQWLQ